MIRNQIGNFYLWYGTNLNYIIWILITQIDEKNNWWEIDRFTDVLGIKFKTKIKYYVI